MLLSVVYQLEMELGVLEINEEKEMAIKLKQIRLIVIDIFGKLCDTDNGIDNLMENNRDHYYLAEDLPTIS